MKKNNKGLSLVELIISMAVLSLVMIPLMTMLIQSARYNGEARQRQKMTLITESVMESFKAYSIEELYGKFNDPLDNTFSGVSLTPTATTNVALNAGEYTFEINELQGEGDIYDAQILVRPYDLDAGVIQSIAELDDMNPYTDAIMRMKSVYDTSAKTTAQVDFSTTLASDIADYLNSGVDLWKNDYDASDFNVDNVISFEKRDTLIHLKREASGLTHAICSMTYYYQVKIPYFSDASDPTVVSMLTFPEELNPGTTYYEINVIVNIPDSEEYYTFYRNDADDVALKRVYLYYYPAYGMKDTITFKTEGFSGDDIECYLIKQMPDGSITDLQSKESSYNVTVKREGSDADLNLYHNLDVNLGGGLTVGPRSLDSNFPVRQDYMSVSKMNVTQPLIYEVTVNIYDGADDARTNVLASLSGTLNK